MGQTIAAIPARDIHRIWPRVVRYLDAALKHGHDMTLQDVYNDLIEDRQILLIVWAEDAVQAAITMEVVEGRHERQLHAVLCGGVELDEWFDVWHGAAKTLAKEHNASTLSLTGRKGWMRKLKDKGFSLQMVTMGQRL